MTARRIFVSYSRRDRDVVKPLVSTLKLAGADVFRDEDLIEPGEEWAKVLVHNIQSCDRIALFWSANAAASEQVTAEWALGLHCQKGIAPILLDKTPLPAELQRFQYVDYSHCVTVSKVEAPSKPAFKSPVKRAPTKDHWKGYLPFLPWIGVVAPPLLPALSFAGVYLALNDNEDARRELADKARALLA